MIYSMTGYANRTFLIGNTSFQIDIRSVNHRFFDFNIKCNDDYKNFEQTLKEIVTGKISRGKLDLRINSQELNNENPNLNINQNLLNSYAQLAKQIKYTIPEALNANIAQIMQLPGMLIKENTNLNEIQPLLIQEVSALVDDLLICQKTEGEKLASIVRDKATQMATIVTHARSLLPQIVDAYKTKLRHKLLETLADTSISDQRLQQEFAYFCQKIDVDEELSRLESHLTQFAKLIKTGGVIGKKIDFLTQEMQREANTFGAKSVSITTTNYALELKILIEQIKEQTQNIM